MRLSRQLRQVTLQMASTLRNSGEVSMTYHFLSLFFQYTCNALATYTCILPTKSKEAGHNLVPLAPLTVQPLRDGDRLASRWGENEVRRQGGKSKLTVSRSKELPVSNLQNKSSQVHQFYCCRFSFTLEPPCVLEVSLARVSRDPRAGTKQDTPNSCDALNPSQSRWGEHTLETHI